VCGVPPVWIGGTGSAAWEDGGRAVLQVCSFSLSSSWLIAPPISLPLSVISVEESMWHFYWGLTLPGLHSGLQFLATGPGLFSQPFDYGNIFFVVFADLLQARHIIGLSPELMLNEPTLKH
jgi:hypothetical protein